MKVCRRATAFIDHSFIRGFHAAATIRNNTVQLFLKLFDHIGFLVDLAQLTIAPGVACDELLEVTLLGLASSVHLFSLCRKRDLRQFILAIRLKVINDHRFHIVRNLLHLCECPGVLGLLRWYRED